MDFDTKVQINNLSAVISTLATRIQRLELHTGAPNQDDYVSPNVCPQCRRIFKSEAGVKVHRTYARRHPQVKTLCRPWKS